MTFTRWPGARCLLLPKSRRVTSRKGQEHHGFIVSLPMEVNCEDTPERESGPYGTCVRAIATSSVREEIASLPKT